MKLVECVPNFSEGRNKDVVDQIVSAIKSVTGVTLLDRSSDADHNRSVITFVGDASVVGEAAFRGIKKAKELIDLEKHTGEHSRMGATDVVPFIPISGVTMEECIEIAKSLGKRVGDELNIPVYLYEAAATRPERENLANVRRGQYEAIKEAIKTDASKVPDFGPSELGSAGATAIGARTPLVAFNVYLGTTDVEVAKQIARWVRHSGGGLRYVKGMGFEITERNLVQVSMNMVNYEGTALYRVFELIRAEAERWGVPVVESEIIGLVPQAALYDSVEYYMRLNQFSRDQILEMRLQKAAAEESSNGDQLIDLKLAGFLDTLASDAPAPGGGSASALASALGSALGSMVMNLTIGKKGYEDVQNKAEALLGTISPLQEYLTAAIDEDSNAFNDVMAAFRMPKETDEQKASRSAEIQKGYKKATSVPLAAAKKALESLRQIAEVVKIGNTNAISDGAVGALLAHAGLKGSLYNVKINLPSIKDEAFVSQIRSKLAGIDDEATRLLKDTLSIVDSKL